jgi:gas vesicle protein
MKKILKKSSGSNNNTGVKIGAGILTAAALAGAAAYLLSGKEGEKRRAKMKTWAVKAQKDVAQKVKMARQMGEAQYKNLVDEAVKRYGSLEKVNIKELMQVAQEMKGDWKNFQRHVKKAVAAKK